VIRGDGSDFQDAIEQFSAFQPVQIVLGMDEDQESDYGQEQRQQAKDDVHSTTSYAVWDARRNLGFLAHPTL
jgi:hypothetical protein